MTPEDRPPASRRCPERRSTSPRWTIAGSPCSRSRRRRGWRSCCTGAGRLPLASALRPPETPAGGGRLRQQTRLRVGPVVLLEQEEGDDGDHRQPGNAGDDDRLSMPGSDLARSLRHGPKNLWNLSFYRVPGHLWRSTATPVNAPFAARGARHRAVPAARKCVRPCRHRTRRDRDQWRTGRAPGAPL